MYAPPRPPAAARSHPDKGALIKTSARRTSLLLVSPVLLALALALGWAGSAVGAASGSSRPVAAVGAESEYANVIGQIGGRYVTVKAIETNPNTDPHSFEASPSVANEIAAAQLVVQNGLGYDSYMDRIESASPSRTRRVIDVQKLLRLPDSTSNPHLWYAPTTMPTVAKAIAADLSALLPADASYFTANVAAFDRSLNPWLAALRAVASRYPHTPVAVTEPVGDYMLAAAGAQILTPFTFQADVMNGVDAAPQDLTFEQSLLSQHRVKLLLYNQQVTDSLTASFLAAARKYGIPVVGAYETMPAGYTYQSWMLAEAGAVHNAIANGTSTQKL